MEEGNLMDRIPILLQRDMEYYEVSLVCDLNGKFLILGFMWLLVGLSHVCGYFIERLCEP